MGRRHAFPTPWQRLKRRIRPEEGVRLPAESRHRRRNCRRSRSIRSRRASAREKAQRVLGFQPVVASAAGDGADAGVGALRAASCPSRRATKSRRRARATHGAPGPLSRVGAVLQRRGARAAADAALARPGAVRAVRAGRHGRRIRRAGSRAGHPVRRRGAPPFDARHSGGEHPLDRRRCCARRCAHRVSLIHANEMPSFQPGGYAARLLGIPAVTHVRFPDSGRATAGSSGRAFRAALFVSRDLLTQALRRRRRSSRAGPRCSTTASSRRTRGRPRNGARERAELGLPARSPDRRDDRTGRRGQGHLGFRRGRSRCWPRAATEPFFAVLGDDLKNGGATRRAMEDAGRGAGTERSLHVPRLPQATRPGIVQAFDIIAVPSHVEPLGNATLEAMAAGRPVVGSRVGGIPEMVVDGRNRDARSPSDPAALADAIGAPRARPGAARADVRGGEAPRPPRRSASTCTAAACRRATIACARAPPPPRSLKAGSHEGTHPHLRDHGARAFGCAAQADHRAVHLRRLRRAAAAVHLGLGRRLRAISLYVGIATLVGWVLNGFGEKRVGRGKSIVALMLAFAVLDGGVGDAGRRLGRRLRLVIELLKIVVPFLDRRHAPRCGKARSRHDLGDRAGEGLRQLRDEPRATATASTSPAKASAAWTTTASASRW